MKIKVWYNIKPAEVFKRFSSLQILNTITDEILEAEGTYKSPLDQVEFIKSQFETKGTHAQLTCNFKSFHCFNWLGNSFSKWTENLVYDALPSKEAELAL